MCVIILFHTSLVVILFENWREYLIERFYSKIRKGWRILEIGTGMLSNLEILLDSCAYKAKVWTVDPSVSSLKKAAKIFYRLVKSGFLFPVEGTAENLKFEDKFFDLVVSTMTFHHVNDVKKAISEAWRVTKNGGYIVILDWSENGAIYTPHDPEMLENAKKKVINAFGELAGEKLTVEEYSEWYVAYAQK